VTQARFFIALFAFAFSFLAAPQAWAHRDDYIDETFVYQTLGSGEREIEGWAETHAGHDRHPRVWYTGAFEYGLTRRWTIDGAAQWVRGAAGLGFGRVRSETRYRFAEEGKGPLDCAMSLEYEAETRRATQGEAERVLTPRLVLSRDLVPAFNTTLNLDFPVSLSDEGNVRFRYAIGARYPGEGFVRAGVEFKQSPAERSSILFPQLWFALPDEATFKVGTGLGLGSSDDPFIGRAVLEAEF
jgi:hypothetical protein